MPRPANQSILYDQPLWQFVALMAFTLSAIAPRDRLTWWLDAAPALAIYALVWLSHRLLPLSAMTRWLLLALMLTILIGAHYGFAEVPAFEQLGEAFGRRRNEFDKFAHLLQGFVPAIAFRELFARLAIVPQPNWRSLLAVTAALALSALYELAEWLAYVLLGGRAEAFIGSQGDAWDAQSDMAMALLGALLAVGLLSRLQDRVLRRLDAISM